MRTKIIPTMFLAALSMATTAQVMLSGRITDSDSLSLPGANVSIKGTYDGTSTDTDGYFRFSTTETGKQILMVSYIGYKTIEQEVDLSEEPGRFRLTMEEQAGEINSVMITAGTFETGGLKRPIVLKPMDIVTTPSAVGDIYGALTTLPGTQVVGNEGGLYVRGGEGYETRTFIDGMYVANPYMSKMPDLPTRSRFLPTLFTGTAFSTGGYSAEYGQALSSAINLKTSGIADETAGAFSIMSVGLNGSYTHRWERSSFSTTLQYINMQPYYSVCKQNREWETSPVQLGGTLLYRRKFGKYGMLRVFGSTDQSHSALYYNYKGDTTQPSLIRLRNKNYYINAVYSDQLADNWLLKTGVAAGTDNNRTGIDRNRLTETGLSFHQRITLTHNPGDKVTWKFGEELSGTIFNRSYFAADSGQTYEWEFRLKDYALYVEPEFHISKNFVTRMGIRSEYITLLNEWQLVPRLSLAWHTGDYSQISLAYGLFRQRPENLYLAYDDELESEKATHLIVNYQYEIDNRIFRIELYNKWYNNLVKYTSETNPDPETYTNAGHGYARGIDLFWRDSKTIRNFDYWISYSYVLSKRNYKDYQQTRVPSYISPHTLSVVLKYFISKINTYAGMTYVFASPKTWYNTALPFSPGDRTKAYNDLSLSITSIRPLLGTYCAFILNISNILGFENVYGYNYSASPDENGKYTRYPIEPQSKRLVVIGAYLIL